MRELIAKDAVSCSHLDLRCPDEDGQSRPVISQPREHSITNIPSNRSTALTNISNCAKYMSYDGTRSIDFHPATNGFATQPATADGASFRGMRSGENDVSPGAFGSLSGQAASNQDTASQNSAYNNHLVRHLHPSQTTQPNLRASGAQEVYLAERTKSRASRFDFPSFEKIHDSSFLKSIVQEPSAKQGFGVPIQPSPQATRPTDRSETGTKVIIDYHHQIQAQNQQIMDMLFDSSNRDQQSAAQSGVMQSCFAFPGQNLQDSQPFDYTHFINTGFDSNAALLNSSFNNPDGAYQCRPAFPNPHHQNISRVSAQQPARHPYAVLDNRASRFGYESQNRTGNGACSRLQSPSFRGLGKLDRAQLDLISQSVPGLEYASISGCWNGPLVPPPPQFHPFLPSSSRTLDHDGQQRQQQREREQQEHSHIVHPAPRRSEYALKAAAIRAMSRSPITSPDHIVVSRASMVASDSGFKIDTPLRRSLVVDFIDPERKASAMDMESVPKSDSPKPCESSTRRIISNKNLGAGIRGPARPGRVRNSRPRTKSKEDKTSQPMLGMSNENQTPAATPAGAKSNGAIAQPPETAKQPVRREVITPRKIAPKPGMSPAEIEAINQYNTSKGGGIQVPFGSGMGPRSNYNVGNYVTRRGASKATGPKIVPPMIPFARVTQPCSATAAPGARDGTPSAKSMAAQALDVRPLGILYSERRHVWY